MTRKCYECGAEYTDGCLPCNTNAIREIGYSELQEKKKPQPKVREITIDVSKFKAEEIEDIKSHIAGRNDEHETYPMPRHGWTCFHCGETFKTGAGARLHFGETPDKTPDCFTKDTGELSEDQNEHMASEMCFHFLGCNLHALPKKSNNTSGRFTQSDAIEAAKNIYDTTINLKEVSNHDK